MYTDEQIADLALAAAGGDHKQAAAQLRLKASELRELASALSNIDNARVRLSSAAGKRERAADLVDELSRPAPVA